MQTVLCQLHRPGFGYFNLSKIKPTSFDWAPWWVYMPWWTEKWGCFITFSAVHSTYINQKCWPNCFICFYRETSKLVGWSQSSADTINSAKDETIMCVKRVPNTAKLKYIIKFELWDNHQVTWIKLTRTAYWLDCLTVPEP